MPLHAIPADAEPLPKRGDDVDEWHTRHKRAALYRAQDWTWPEIAEQLDCARTTVQDYTKIDGFHALVTHLEAVVHRERLKRSDLETFEIVVEYKPKVLRALAEAAIGEEGERDPRAAAKFLRAIGFYDKNKALGELQARQQLDGGGDDGGTIVVDTTLEDD